MQGEKSFAYTMILGVCMLISLLLIARMLLTPKPIAEAPQMQQEKREDAEVEIEISNTLLAEMISDAAPISIENLALEITNSGEVMVQGSVSKEVIRENIEDGALRTMLMFLPETCDMDLSCKVGLVDGALEVSDAKASIAGIDVPTGLIQVTQQQMNEVINEKIQEYGIDTKQISFTENKIILS